MPVKSQHGHRPQPSCETRYGNYIDLAREQGEPAFYQTEKTKSAIAEQHKRFGKNLLFANGNHAQAPWIIEQYRSKDRIEDGFKLLKQLELIRWRPCRHRTDTKIRAFAFCCIMVYEDKHADRKTTQRSNVQQRPWDIFGLSPIEKLTLR